MSTPIVLIIIIILTATGSLWFWYQSTVLGEYRRNIENSLLALQLEIKSNDEILAEAIAESGIRRGVSPRAA